MKTHLTEAGYILKKDINVWSRPDYNDIDYNDGDIIEKRIFSIIEEASDISVLSTELRQHCDDWPSFYHLGRNRSNILRPFSGILNRDVLEIGSGCGAITRYLGECGGNILALEGSTRRAAITRSRTRDLENVTVIAENFVNFTLGRKFDLITLIGVLEYANLFSFDENPQLSMLKHLRSFLKANGKLIIAIENQLGLKYFAGAAEDHHQQPMVGIEGRYSKDQPQTFGRKVLAGMLEDTGFTEFQFLAPFPDYKLPVSIITEEGINHNYFDSAAFAWQSARNDLQLPTTCNLSLELAWPEIFRNKIGMDLANSFLIIASPTAQGLVETGVLAYHYTTDRISAYCKETVFECTGQKSIRVRYRPICNLKKVNRKNIKNNRLIEFNFPKEGDYKFGKPLSLEFIHIVTKDDWSFQQISVFINRYLSIVANFAKLKNLNINLRSPYAELPGEFFDVVPQNIIICVDGRPRLIDEEWKLSQPIEIGHLLFRSLILMINSVSRFSLPVSGEALTCHQFIEKIFSLVGLSLKQDDYIRYSKYESDIQVCVTGHNKNNFPNFEPDRPLAMFNLTRHMTVHQDRVSTLNKQIQIRDQKISLYKQDITGLSSQISELQKQISELQKQISELQKQISSLTAEINDIITSKSWRYTEHLRNLQKIILFIVLPFFRQKIFKSTLWIYHRVPLSVHLKHKVKNKLINKIPGLLSLKNGFLGRQTYLSIKSFSKNKSVFYKVFDDNYYRTANPDVMEERVDPLQHFYDSGWREGRNPHPLFNVAYYLHVNPDVKKAGVNPLEHYLITGWREGRKPHPVFDSAYYSKTGWYPENCGISPLEYYLRYRCAATGLQLIGFDSLLPRLQESSPSDISENFLTETPLITIIMPTYNTPTKYLEASIASVLSQSYENWELCITDDGSNLPQVHQCLEHFGNLDSRIKIKLLKKNEGISAATNEALHRSRGDYVAMLDHDDTLDPDALLEFVKVINIYPDADAIYSDQDIISEEGKRVGAYYKPDWSPELMRGVMYVGHLLMVRRSTANAIGGFDSHFDRVQDYEFMLRVGERTDCIHHIPKILYHWRMIPGSIAYDGDSKGKVEPLQCAAVNAHLDRLALLGKATPHEVHAHRALILPDGNTVPKKINVIIAQATNPDHMNICLNSLLSDGTEIEVWLLNKEAVSFSKPGLRINSLPKIELSKKGSFVLAEFLNTFLKENGVDYVLFMERPMKLSPHWAERLALYSGRPNALLVSPLIIDNNDTVAEAGLILDPLHGVVSAMVGWNPESDGMAGSLSCSREVSAVSAACVFFKHSKFQQVGGFDSLYRMATFQIADLSLTGISQGLTNLYVSSVTAEHFPSANRDQNDDEYLDRELFLDRWRGLIDKGDRYHNPNYLPNNGGYAN